MTLKSIFLISLLLPSVIGISVQLAPMAIFQDGIETDTMIVQELFTVKDFNFGIGFNLKRFGMDVGYTTPWLFRGILIHFGIFHRWEDLNKQFLPAFGIGISIKF